MLLDTLPQSSIGQKRIAGLKSRAAVKPQSRSKAACGSMRTTDEDDGKHIEGRRCHALRGGKGNRVIAEAHAVGHTCMCVRA